MVNPMSLIADRLGGADYDGDEVCIINDDLLLEKVYPRLINKNNTYVYQLVKIPSVTNHLNKGDSLYAKHIYSLESTFSNRTGIISNLAFEKTLNAYWSLKPNMKEISDVSFFTVLGGLEIDLRDAKINEDIVLELTAVLGGIDIFIPDNVSVEIISGNPILGGFEHKINKNVIGGPKVRIKYIAVLGGIEVK